MSIKVLRLKTGEELIADVVGINTVDEKEVLEDTLTLGQPFSLHLIPTEEGIGIQLMPWAIYARDHKSIPFPSSEVAFCIEPSTGIRNQYAEMIGLPVVPDKSIITPEGNPNIKLV